MNTPVALFLFNRPSTTRIVFDRIAQARPKVLLLVADGPRSDLPGEEELCAAARRLAHKVSWPCEVLTNFSSTHLGYGEQMASGIQWVFSQVEEAILLEDDTVPHPSFFPYCEELLERFRYDERIGHIAGCNFISPQRRTSNSYFFSRYNYRWGWASWSRVMRQYDKSMSLWPTAKEEGLLYDLFSDNELLVQFWSEKFDEVYNGRIDSWDLQYTFLCWMQGYLSITPAMNLISNIGFGPAATHTKEKNLLANLLAEELEIPLKHPQYIVRDHVADTITEHFVFNIPHPALPERAQYVLGTNQIIPPWESKKVRSLEKFHQALEYFHLGMLSEALGAVEESVAFSFFPRGVFLLKGIILAQQQDSQGALRSLLSEYALHPDNQEVLQDGKRLFGDDFPEYLTSFVSFYESQGYSSTDEIHEAIRAFESNHKEEAFELLQKVSLGAVKLHYEEGATAT